MMSLAARSKLQLTGIINRQAGEGTFLSLDGLLRLLIRKQEGGKCDADVCAETIRRLHGDLSGHKRLLIERGVYPTQNPNYGPADHGLINAPNINRYDEFHSGDIDD